MSSVGKSKRLLITGASGFLGWHLCRLAAAKWSVIGVARRNPVAADDATPLAGDLRDAGFVATLLETIQPGAVIHAAAESSSDACEKQGNATRRINVIAAENLARECGLRKLPFVFTSTDMVFDGTRPPYGEDDPTTPISAYGRQKAEAEACILACCPEALICRLPLLIGCSGVTGGSFSMRIVKALIAGNPLNLFVDEYRTPVDGESAAAGILTLLGQATGILHLGGRDRISRYRMGLWLADIMGCRNDTLRPVSINDTPTAARRAPDVSLNSQRAYKLGYDPTSLDLALRRMVASFRVDST